MMYRSSQGWYVEPIIPLSIVLQPREELLLPIMQVLCELVVRNEHGTHHLQFPLETIQRSWEYRVLEQVLCEVVARSELQSTCTGIAT